VEEPVDLNDDVAEVQTDELRVDEVQADELSVHGTGFVDEEQPSNEQGEVSDATIVCGEQQLGLRVC
jgi:hypothetical protein